MSRYPPSSHYSPPAIAGSPAQDSAGSSRPNTSPSASRAGHPGRHDRDSSLSDSETSASLNAYSESVNDSEAPAGAAQEAADDPYLALTSQTLNADGTPKRPMNAFMIFARKRRPQISAANQMMRTGDVSKILSKEWNSMDMSEKKFYLDQAKKLKDNFNSKYPDYVYRRRPNNSRKKRKPDAAHEDGQDAHLADPDDPGYDDTSPIDPDDALMIPSPQEVQYTRGHALNASPLYHNPHSSGAVGPSPPPPSSGGAACTYPYQSEFNASHSAMQSSRLQHLSQDTTLPGSAIDAVRSAALHDIGGMSHGYASQSMYHPHGHPSSMYSTQAPQTSPGMWDPSRAGAGTGAGPRSDHARSNWPVLPALDTSLARQRSYTSTAGGHLGAPPPPPSAGNGKSDAYSPQPPTRPWSSATSSTASSSSSASASQHYAAQGPGGAGSNAFPTLSSAFFPPGESPGASPASAAHDYYSPAAARRASSSGGHDHGYGAQYAQSGAAAHQHAHQWSQPYSRPDGAAAGAGAGGLHSISPYSMQGSPGEASSRSASGSSAHSAAPLGFWDDRYGGR